MQRTNKISVAQLFSLLLLSRLLTTLTFSPSLSTEYPQHEWIAGIFIMIIFIAVLAIPAYIALKDNPDKNLIDKSKEISQKFSQVIGILYFLVYIYVGIITIQRFDIFTSSLIFPQKDIMFFIVITIFLSGYIAYLGLEAMSRAAVILLGFVFAGIFFILATVLPKFNLLNIEPPFYYGLKDSVKFAMISAAKTTELGVLLVMLPNVKGNVKKGFLFWLLALISILFIMLIILLGVLGEFSKTQIFPFYSLAVLAEFGVLERMDSVLTGVWILSLLMRLSLAVLMCSEMLCYIFKKEKMKHYIIASCSILSIGSIVLSKYIIVFSKLLSGILSIALAIVFSVVIPLLIALLCKLNIKRRQKA